MVLMASAPVGGRTSCSDDPVVGPLQINKRTTKENSDAAVICALVLFQNVHSALNVRRKTELKRLYCIELCETAGSHLLMSDVEASLFSIFGNLYIYIY
jgi:hypothetical protein